MTRRHRFPSRTVSRSSSALAVPLAALSLLLAGCSAGPAAPGSGSGGAAGGASHGSSAAAGGSSSSGSGSGDVGCSLLPVATANLALTVANLTVDSATPNAGNSCAYVGKGVSFSTRVRSDQSAADWASEVAYVKQAVGDAPSIPSLGDRAVGAVRLLVVQKGSTIIELNGQVDDTGSPAQNVADLSMLASAMLDNVK